MSETTPAAPAAEDLKSLTPAERLARRITVAHTQDLMSKQRQPSSQPYTYLSGIHSCARHLYYLMTAGEKRPGFDLYTLGLFEAGQEAEVWVKRKLLAWGLEMMKSQQEILIRYAGARKELHGQLMGKGKVDGIFLLRDEWTDPKGIEVPGEVKSMGEQMFKKLNTVDDLLEYPHTEKYVKQLLMYMYGEGKENGIFILTDCRGHIKPIPVFLGNHLELAEFALRTMEKAWEAKAAGQAPDRVEWHSKTCGRCPFAPICLPTETFGGGAEVIEDPELEATIAEYLRVKEVGKDEEELSEGIKARVKGLSQATVGRFVVVPKERKRTSYDAKQLDPETREKIKKETSFVVLDIKDLGDGQK